VNYTISARAKEPKIARILRNSFEMFMNALFILNDKVRERVSGIPLGTILENYLSACSNM
jgi:hypothetical protein